MRIAGPILIFLVLIQEVAVCGAAPFADGYAKSMLTDQGSCLESEIANLMEKRGEPNDLNAPLLELQIDLRIIDRLLYLAAAEAPPQSDLQVCCTLRAISFASAGKQLGQLLQNARGPLTESQLEGLRKFHDMTFSPPELKSVANVDKLCHDAGVALFISAGPLAAGLKDLPMMRPAPVDSGPASPVTSAPPPKLSELAERAEKLSVSTPLRRQLLALASSAAAPRPPDAGPALTEAMGQAVELADGIAHNTALDPATRPRVETQLAESLALFADVRTRGAGRSRLQTLGRYHQTLERIRRLKLNAELRDRLGPAFLWIQQNPDTGGKVFDVIERYLGECSRFDSRKPSSSLPPNQHKLIEDMSRQFSAHRSAFLDVTSQFGGLVVAAPFDSLSAHVSAMDEAIGAIDSVERLPRALQTLAAYKPRPSGGLERRAGQAVTSLASVQLSSHEPAGGVIVDIERLAALAADAGPIAGNIPGATAKTWAAGKLEAFDSRRSALVTELASQLASGHDMDAEKVAQLKIAADLAAALREAAFTDAVVHHGESMARWVDWQIDAEQLRNLIAPCRDSTVAAFEGFAQGDALASGQWVTVYHRFVPIIAFINAATPYTSACDKLPDGLPCELGKLLTPMDGQPFALERRLSFTLALRGRATQANDAAAVKALTDSIIGDLRRELHIAE